MDGASADSSARRGGGSRTIISMVNHTRLDCVIGVAGQMRAGFGQAVHHARHRRAFGKLLIDQPLMRTCWPTWPSSPRPPPSA